tara:strand:- start:298 stop:561 length:264 start_codon:yes stop_codon:yes gene_type:complete
MRDQFVSIVDGFFAEGLLITQFVDIDETSLFFINLWKSKSDSERVHQAHQSLFVRHQDMGVKISMSGGMTTVKYASDDILNILDKKT